MRTNPWKREGKVVLGARPLFFDCFCEAQTPPPIISKDELCQSIINEISDLLNTRSPLLWTLLESDGVDQWFNTVEVHRLEGFNAFGLNDTFDPTIEALWSGIEVYLETILSHFEPRISDPRVTITGFDHYFSKFHLRISGDVYLSREIIPLAFVSTMSIDRSA